MTTKFISLPLLDSYQMSEESERLLSNNTLLVGVQHLLETTGSLLEKLISHGIKPSDIFLTGKYYSTSVTVSNKLTNLGINLINDEHYNPLDTFETHMQGKLDKLWALVEAKLNAQSKYKNIIILDDGGRCVETIPKHLTDKYHVSAVEQTTSGIERLKTIDLPLNIVTVASSKLKLTYESPHIANKAIAVLERKGVINKGIINRGGPSSKITVVGKGSIGSSMLTALNTYTNIDVNSVDLVDFKNNAQAYEKAMMSAFLSSDIIIGCTGSDISKTIDFNQIVGNKTFISVSSEDIEFKTLIDNYNNQWRQNNQNSFDITLKLKNSRINIIERGFPVNFDKSEHSVPAKYIALTRCLLLAGVEQGAEILLSNKDGFAFVPLRDDHQSYILAEWNKLLEHEEKL